MSGRLLKNILVFFLCITALLTGAFCGASFAGAGLSFAAQNESGGDESDDPASKRPLIRVGTWYNDYNLMYLEAFLAKTFPDYDFKFEYVDKSNYEPIMDSKLSYKGAPDILYVDREMVSKHALSGYIEDITDLMDDFDDKARLSFMYGTRIYAVPCTSQFECIFYNRDMLSENGISVPHSYFSFMDCCDKLMKKDIKPVTTSLKNPYDTSNLVLAYIAANYLHTDRGKGFGGRLQYGRTTFLDELGPYMKDFEEMMQHGIYTRDMCVLDELTAVEEFTRGDAAMIIGGPEIYNAIVVERPGMNIGTMPFFGKNGRAIIGGCDVGLALNSNAEYKDEAMQVLITLATEKGQRAMWRDRPGSQTYRSDASFDNGKVFDGIKSMIDDDLAFTPWMDWGKDLNKTAYFQLGRETQRALLGRESIDTALSNVDKVVYKILHR